MIKVTMRVMCNPDIYYLKLESHIVRLLVWLCRCRRVSWYLSGASGWSMCNCLACGVGGQMQIGQGKGYNNACAANAVPLYALKQVQKCSSFTCWLRPYLQTVERLAGGYCLLVALELRCQLRQNQIPASTSRQPLHHVCQILQLSQSDFQSSDSTDDTSNKYKYNFQ